MKTNILPLMNILAAVLALTIAMSDHCEADAPSPPKFQQTQKICQLTGDIDRGIRGSAGPATGMTLGGGNYGITGTDIGWSFEHGDQLSFMFGDTRDFSPDRCDPGACGVRAHPQPAWPNPIDLWQDWTGPNPQDLSNPNMYRDWLDTHGDSADSWASAAAGSDPETCLPLQVARDRTGNHRSTLLNGRIMPRGEGAYSGFSDGNNIYAFATRISWPIGCPATGCGHDDSNPGGKTALALSRDGGATFDEIVHFSTTHFQFVAPNVVSGSLFPELLPAGLSSHNFLLAFGAGRSQIDPTHMTPWNASYPYLAISDVANVADKAPTVDGVAAFAHRLSWNPIAVGAPVALAGPAIGLAPEDKWVLPYKDKALVVRSDGYVWYQTISFTGVGGYNALPPHVQPSGYVPLVAVNPLDKWVVPDPKRDRILVVTADGRVYAHGVTDHIEAPNHLSTPAPVAARPEDNWVLVVGDRLIVITKRGLVYGHPITGPDGNTIAPATLLSDPANPDTLVAGTIPPGTPTERWVFADGDNIMTVTGQGAVYAHPIAPVQIPGQPAVGRWQWVSGYPQVKVGWSDNDRWLLPIHTGSGDDLLVAITYKATGFRYLHLDPNGRPSLVGDEASASPLWNDAHECLGYFSVRYLEPPKKWAALYTCSTDTVPRGVYLRVADKPWGPWSAPVAVMKVPGTANPYCWFMHLPPDDAPCPTFAPNPFEDEKRAPGKDGVGRRQPGGEYAPFLLPSNYHKYSANGTIRLYFTLSTWNPYQTVLMSTDVGLY